MNYRELENDDLVIDWFKRVRARPHTKDVYLYCLQEYTNLLGMTPIQLIEEAEEGYDARVRPRKQKIRKYITEFREHLVNKGMAPLSIENRIAGVRSFYKSQDIIIPELDRKENTATILEAHKGIPSKEDIRKVLCLADPLEKALILTGLSSGLAVNEICELKVYQFTKGLDKENWITTLNIRREKKQVDYVTFTTPECSHAIQEYLDYRNRIPKNGNEESAIPLRKQKIISDIGYLFIKRSVPEEYLKTGNEELRKLSEHGVQETYRELCVSVGLSAGKGVWNPFRSHLMRKWMNNRLIAAKCDTEDKEFLMGHKIGNKTKASYYVGDPAELKERYRQMVPFLTVEKSIDISESPDYQRIKDENDILRAETARHIVENREIQELRVKIEQLEKDKENDKQLHEKFGDMIAGEVSHTNQYPGWEKDYRIHEKRLKEDPEYKRKFEEFHDPFIYSWFKDPDFKPEYDEFMRKESGKKTELNKAQKTLFDKL